MSSRLRLVSALVLAAILLSLVASAAEKAPGTLTPRGTPLGSDFRVGGSTTPAMDSQPAAAWSDSARQYLVVWMDGRDLATRGTDIYGQRVSAAGAPLGTNFAIGGPAALGHDTLPAVTWNETRDEYLVVWSDYRDPTRRADIYGQRLSVTGERLRGNFRISGDGGINDESQPSVAWNADVNEYLVVWSDQRNLGERGEDIYGQRLSATGDRLGGNFRISGATATDLEFDAAVAWNPASGEYLVVWADYRNRVTRGLDIYGQRVMGDGRRLGGNFRISGADAVEDETEPMLACNADANQCLVVWQDSRSGGHSASDIYGRRVAGDGRRLGADFRVSGLTWSTGGLLPVVAWNAKVNEYLVVWADRRNEPISGYDIYGQEVAWNGRPDGGNFRISGAGATALEGAPGIAYNTNLNQYLVVWQDRRTPAQDYDIWARLVSG